MSKKKELYVQCELDHGNNGIEVAWIPERLAIDGLMIKLEDYDHPIKVNKAYGRVKHTLEEIEINRYNPLRKATDI